MHAQQIRCFLESAEDLFSTMLNSKIEFCSPEMSPQALKHDVSGIIGFSGDVIGTVVVGFPSETAIAAVEAFAGCRMEVDDENFPDAIGELANMIAGGAKARMDGNDISISCPSVVVGKDYVVQSPKQVSCVKVPCQSPLGAFDVIISINEAKQEARAA